MVLFVGRMSPFVPGIFRKRLMNVLTRKTDMCPSITAAERNGVLGCRLPGAIMILAIGLAVTSHGCSPQYAPFRIETDDGSIKYLLTTRITRGDFNTRLTRYGKDDTLSISFDGKGEEMAISPDARTLAVAISVFGRAPYIALIQADTLSVASHIPIIVPKVIDDVGYSPSVRGIDCLSLSHGSDKVAAYLSKPSPQGGHEAVILVWDTPSGKLLRELQLPQPDAYLQGKIYSENVSSMAFSAKGELLAASGAWSIKDPHVEQPDGFIRVWRVSDGKDVATLRPKGRVFLWNLCLDHTGNYLAGWSWTGQGTECAQVSVWHLAEGKEIVGKLIVGRVRGIVWSEKTGVFKVYTAQNQEVYISPAKNLRSSR